MAGPLFRGTAGKFTWRMLATVLAGESIVILFGALVARAIAASGPDASRSTAYLLVGFGLATLCIVAAGSLRRPWGAALGWAVQLLTLASALIVPMMLVVGLIFLGLWIVCLVQGPRIDAADAERAMEGDASTDRVAE